MILHKSANLYVVNIFMSVMYNTLQALVGVSRSVYSVMWKYVMCDVSPTSTTTPVTSTVTTAPTPDFVIPLWVGSDYSNVSNIVFTF